MAAITTSESKEVECLTDQILTTCAKRNEVARQHQTQKSSSEGSKYLVTIPTGEGICAIVAKGQDEERVQTGGKGSETVVGVS